MTLPHLDIQIFDAPLAEFQCVSKALESHLGRYPNENDLKLLSRSKNKNSNGEDAFILAYKKQRMGIIRMKFKFGEKDPFKVSFTPFFTLN